MKLLRNKKILALFLYREKVAAVLMNNIGSINVLNTTDKRDTGCYDDNWNTKFFSNFTLEGCILWSILLDTGNSDGAYLFVLKMDKGGFHLWEGGGRFGRAGRCGLVLERRRRLGCAERRRRWVFTLFLQQGAE